MESTAALLEWLCALGIVTVVTKVIGMCRIGCANSSAGGGGKERPGCGKAEAPREQLGSLSDMWVLGQTTWKTFIRHPVTFLQEEDSS